MTTQNPLWWQSGVVYQIYPRSFMDSNGDGIGDLDGITSRIDYLADLGIDAIWLSPFMKSPMKDFGYDVSDYTDVDPIFGDIGAFDRLVQAAHARGIRIVIDYVPNHSSDQHPWFIESRSSKDNPKRDWYVWRDRKADGSPPNNWVAVFGGSSWEYDPHTDQSYLHSFLTSQPDLNWRNPEVKAAMLDALRVWLERGVDGFRIDVAHFIMKDPALRDNPVNASNQGVAFKPMGQYDTLIHVHDKGHPDVHGIFREMRALFDSYSGERPRYSVGEIHEFDWDLWASYYGQNLDELHMPFNFGLVNVAWEAGMIQERIDAVETATAKLPKLPAPGAWPNYVLGNHDEHRIASRIGIGQARVAMMLLLTLRGTPTIYYGDELGMADGHIPPEKEQDPWGKQMPGLGLGRDPERTPMQWNTSPNAGFSPAGVETWLPVADHYTTINVESQQKDPRSMLNFTKRLLALRRSEAALSVGDYQALGGLPADVFAFTRATAGKTFVVVLNLSGQPRKVNAPAGGHGEIILATDMVRSGSAVLEDLSLAGDEGLIIQLR
jgi:alpha-glucosidase